MTTIAFRGYLPGWRYLFTIALLVCIFNPAKAQDAVTPPIEKLREISRLLADPQVAAWLDYAQTVNRVPQPPAPVAGMQSGYVAERLDAINARLATVMRGSMEVAPGVKTAVEKIAAEVTRGAVLHLFLLMLLIHLLAVGFERTFDFLSERHWRRHLAESVPAVPVGLHACGQAISFAVGALLPLAIVNWPPLMQRTAVIFAIAAIVLRSTTLFGGYIVWLIARPGARKSSQIEEAAVAPGDEAAPANAPASDSQAWQVDPSSLVTPSGVRYWFSRFQCGLRIFVTGWTVVELMKLFGFAEGAVLLGILASNLALFILAVEAVWRRPRRRDHGETARKVWSWLMTLAVGLLLILWIIGLHILFWTGLLSLLLPPVLRLTTAVVARLHGGTEVMRPSGIGFVISERGVRALLIILAAWWIASVAGVDAAGMMMGTGDTLISRVARAVTQAIAVLLVADIFWQFLKAEISVRMAEEPHGRHLSDAQIGRNARIRTLLPILHNILAIILGAVAVMMVLTSIGVDIGPLIAGAGVAGVAIGFGAQTIVKDLISGIFYLWDDAFRIGEYIETGKYKGEVESFSLRSVKLRHHRGPLTTVPFGDLGAVQNMSRDWSVTKFNISVPYDTDLEKLRKVIKRIGTDIAEKPEYKEILIDPLKMKGVAEFGEYAVVVRVGFTTKPGEQFLIRREIMNRIVSDFKANDIQFASPTVQVGGANGYTNATAAAGEIRRRRGKITTE